MRPNIVFLMSDQQRWDTLGCYGNTFVETPHLDRLAAEGARFGTCVTPWPVCTPSRASLWTGVYPHVHGLVSNLYGEPDAIANLSPVKTTVFDLLREAGYVTGYIGKWHLGEDDPGMFDVWNGFNSQGGHWVDGKTDGIYKPDVQTDATIDFLRERAKHPETPFVVVNSFYPPHDPYTAPERFFEPYRRKGVPFAGYYAAVSAIDENVGRMLTALDELGLADNTVVIYTSDHGDTFKYRHDGMHKHVCFDEAICVPLIVRWPGRVRPGSVVGAPVSLLDLLPTMLAVAGSDAPEHAHGLSLVPWLDGETPSWREASYVQTITRYEGHNQRCLRTDAWKLVVGETGPNHLYDLVHDPEEENNLYRAPLMDGEQPPAFPSHVHIIEPLVRALAHVASEVDDDVGIRAAERALAELATRDVRRGGAQPR